MRTEKDILRESFRRIGLSGNYLGIPTLVLRPEEFDGLSQEQTIKKWEIIARQFFLESEQFDPAEGCSLYEYFNAYLNRFVKDAQNFKVAFCIPMTKKGIPFHAPWNPHHRNPENFSDYRANVIVMGRERYAGPEFINLIFKATGVAPDLPVTPSRKNLKDLYHEAGHGIGCGEPQAEKFSSIIEKQNFGDNAHLMYEGDLRALTALFQVRSLRTTLIYGWQMVDAIDDVVSMHKEEIDSFTSEDLKNLRFEKFDRKLWPLYSVAATLAWNSFGIFKRGDLPELAETMNRLLKTGKFGPEESETYRIAARIHLAAQRLSGLTPYQTESIQNSAPQIEQ